MRAINTVKALKRYLVTAAWGFPAGDDRGSNPKRSPGPCARSALACALAFFGCLAGAFAGGGEGYSNNRTNPPAFKAWVRVEGGPGLRTARRAYVSAGTNRFAFVVPDGFRMESSDAERAILVSPDLSCQIVFRILDPVGGVSTELDPAAYRELLLSRYPGAKILEEQSRTVADRTGPAINLRWNDVGHIAREGSFVFIPFEGQVLELSFAASPERFNAAWPGFYSVLLTFRASDRNGKLTVPMLSDRI
jgi:hypothetical protein